MSSGLPAAAPKILAYTYIGQAIQLFFRVFYKFSGVFWPYKLTFLLLVCRVYGLADLKETSKLRSLGSLTKK